MKWIESTALVAGNTAETPGTSAVPEKGQPAVATPE